MASRYYVKTKINGVDLSNENPIECEVYTTHFNKCPVCLFTWFSDTVDSDVVHVHTQEECNMLLAIRIAES